MLARGYRPETKPSFETIDAIERVMLSAGEAADNQYKGSHQTGAVQAEEEACRRARS
jgi:hypothetical protein